MRQRTIIASTAVLFLMGAKSGPHWSYEGAQGPSHWGGLDLSYMLCKVGKKQSPIDIRGTHKIQIKTLDFQYHPSPLNVINNGHTIQFDFAGDNILAIDGKKFSLKQVHFHTPSEHRVVGREYALEAHLVHQSDDKQLAVVGVLFNTGGENLFINQLWANLPTQKNSRVQVAGSYLSAEAFLPKERFYFHYIGSLTTPPCTEGVNWFVMATPLELSEHQLEAFKRVYSMNARPVQEVNDRYILKN